MDIGTRHGKESTNASGPNLDGLPKTSWVQFGRFDCDAYYKTLRRTGWSRPAADAVIAGRLVVLAVLAVLAGSRGGCGQSSPPKYAGRFACSAKRPGPHRGFWLLEDMFEPAGTLPARPTRLIANWVRRWTMLGEKDAVAG